MTFEDGAQLKMDYIAILHAVKSLNLANKFNCWMPQELTQGRPGSKLARNRCRCIVTNYFRSED